VQVKTKNVAVIALGVVLVLLLWYRMVYSSMSSQATKSKQATQNAQLQVDALQRQLRQSSGDSAGGQAKKASADELQHAIPVTPGLSNFLRTTDKIRAATGIGFQSITPSAPTAVGNVQTINLGIVVQGPYRQVLAYLDALMKTRRLVIVDNVSVTVGGSSGSSPAPGGATAGGPAGEVFAGVGGPPTLQVQLTARLFTQAPAGVAIGSSPAGAAASTTKTPAGGPAAPPSGVQNN
jgi:Tfp pilus assembly protein PilO